MKLKTNPLDLLFVFIYGILFGLTIASDTWGRWLLAYTIWMCFRLMWLHRYNQPILIILIFATSYFVYMLLYYFMGIHYSTYRNFQTLQYTNGTLRVISLFVLILFYGIHKKQKGDPPFRNHLDCTRNDVIFIVCIIVMILICIYAYMGKNIFNHQYGRGTTNSSLFEYYFMFAITAQCNARSKRGRRILFLINSLYIVAMLLLGLRLVTLMVIMLLFVFYFEDRYKTIWIVLASVMGFFFMSALALIRKGLLQFDWRTLLGVHDGYLFTNQGDIFLASTVHYGITQNGFMSLIDRITSLFAFILNIFLPSSKQFTIGILNEYVRPTYSLGGGGFGAMYAYVWLGYVGVILLAFFIGHFINAAYESKRTAYYGLFLIVTSFRWFAYSLPIVFKMGLYLAILYNIMRRLRFERKL